MSAKLIGAADLLLTSSTGTPYRPGEIVAARHGTYGAVTAQWIYSSAAVTTAGAPMYPVVASWLPAGLYDCLEDENGTGVLGQEFCIGSWLGGVTTVACYGFVQLTGLNLSAVTTDDSVPALGIVGPSSTDGTWLGATLDALTTDATNTGNTRNGFAYAADGGTSMAVGTIMWNSPWAFPPTL